MESVTTRSITALCARVSHTWSRRHRWCPERFGRTSSSAIPMRRNEEVQAVLRLLRLDDAIEALPNGLDTALTATSLSGGQRQRIAMARAVLRPSALLLLDEATAQVDTLTEAAIVDAINERARTGAVVTIAHRLSTVRDADWIVVMEDGRIRNIGNHDELMDKDDLYRDMVVAGRLDQGEAMLEDC